MKTYYQQNRERKVSQLSEILKEYANMYSEKDRKCMHSIFQKENEERRLEIFLSLIRRDLPRTYKSIERTKKTALNLFLTNL